MTATAPAEVGTGAERAVWPPSAVAAVLRPDRRPLVALALAVGLWVQGFWGADPRRMTDLGLVSLFTPQVVVALALLTVSFLLVVRRGGPEWLLAAHLVTYLALVHGTPAVLYGTPRYEWTWKHIGIVDYILRHGGVDTTIHTSQIYHNWPGFFAASALVTRLGGAHDAIPLGLWAPLFFNLLNLLALRFLMRSLTTDRRVVWLAMWFFFVINWVGQDYFSPQAMAFGLYLVLIGVLLRAFRRPGAPRSPDVERLPVLDRRIGWVLVLLLVTAIASSHQITPVTLVAVVAALTVFRRTRPRLLLVVVVVIFGGWMLLVARGFTIANGLDLVDSLGKPVSNAEDTLNKADALNAAQEVVSRGGRLVVVVAGLAALGGVARSWVQRRVDATALLLMLVPGVLVVLTNFGGEVIFRVFLFASPFLGYFIAVLLRPLPSRARLSLRATAGGLLLTAVLLPGFMLGYYGKERQNFFTGGEVAAAAWVYRHGPPGSLIVEGTRNYPAQFLNYENFIYVPINREPEPGLNAVIADPVDRMQEWMSDARYPAAYLLITQSMKTEVDSIDPMPDGSLAEIEADLRASPRFRVAYETADAVVFTLAGDGDSGRGPTP